MSFEEFLASPETDKLMELKLNGICKSYRSKLTMNVKRHFPELVSLLKKDAPAGTITILEE